MFLAKLFDCRLSQTVRICAKKGRIGLDDYAVFIAVINNVALLAPWMKLNLVDSGNRRGEVLEVFDAAGVSAGSEAWDCGRNISGMQGVRSGMKRTGCARR